MLESYITPLLMGYVNKYIKNLKPSDLSLSVWGGDVVLQNLELHLDVLQKELNLPVKFLSGKIHKLRIHVPWTRITYEPVEITINTIEFIVKLRDPDEQADENDDKADEENKKEMKKELHKAKVQRDAEHLPPGYVQGVLNKVINNITICVNNLIVKYVEDDIVFSLNIKSASLFSANEKWEKAFIELALPSLCLRKICNINDLTICLDSRNADGKIEMYQDPLLYKCNLSCRILSKYQGIGSTSAYENQVNLYCESLDMSATDLQLPMLVRLLKMCLGLYYRTLDLPGCNYKTHPANDILEERKHKQSFQSSANKPDSGEDEDSGWVSWAWSKIPYFSDDLSDVEDMIGSYNHDTVLVFAFYVTQCSLTLKCIEEAGHKSIVGTSRRFVFSPVLNIEMSGCAMETLLKGDEFFDCQMGLSYIVGYIIGDCLCKKGRSAENIISNVSFEDANGDDEDELFLRIGCPKDSQDDGVGFMKNSLFSQLNQSDDDKQEATVLPRKGSQFKETEVMQKFSAFFLDYFYTMELPENEANDDSKPAYGKASELVKEASSKRVIVGKTQTFLTSKLHHLFTRIADFCSEDRGPTKKVKDKPFVDPFVVKQLKLGNLPIRSLHLTCHSTSIQMSFADHSFSKTHKATSTSESINFNTEHNNLYGLILQVDRLDYQAHSPMFPNELNFLIENDAQTNALLHRAAFSDYYLKMFGIQVGIYQHLPECPEATVLNVISPVHLSLFLKHCINESVGRDRFTMELRVETPSINVSITKPQLLMLISFHQSWTLKDPLPVNECLIGDIFHPKANKDGMSSVLDLSLIGLQGKYVKQDSYHAISASLGSIKAAIQALCNGVELTTAIMHGPLNTAIVSDVDVFLNAKDKELLDLPNGVLLNAKLQFPTADRILNEDNPPAVILFELKGMAVNCDPSLLRWIEYMPTSSAESHRLRTFQRRTSKVFSRTLSSSTPKKKSYSRVYGASQLSRERKKENKARKKDQEESEKKNDYQNQMAYVMHILKSLIIKVDVETIAILMPTKSMLSEQDGTTLLYNILYIWRACYRNTPERFPDSLVLTLPQLRLSSSNIKDLASATDIPVTISQNKTIDNSLPWSLNGQAFSIYTMNASETNKLPDNEACYIFEPAEWTMLLAAAHADAAEAFSSLHDSLSLVGVKPVMNPIEEASLDSTKQQNQPSLGFCVHIDLSSVMIGISMHQMSIMISVLSRLLTTVNNFHKLKAPANRLFVEMHLDQQVELNSNSKKSTTEDDRRSVSSNSTTEPLDDVTVSNDASVSSSQMQTRSEGAFSVSLWLQWIIPKMSITLYSDPSFQDGIIYKIPIELDEISFAFDHQKGKLQMTNKVGSLAVRNYMLRPGNNSWETDKFDGVLVSCKDILGQNIELLSSPSKSNSRSFINMTYSRIALSEVHSRSRYASIRSEAALVDQDKDDVTFQSNNPMKYTIDETGVYQHKVFLSVQSLDVVAVLEPVVHVANSLLAVDVKSLNLPEKASPIVSTEPGKLPREGVFQPLPVVSIEVKGIRVLVPASTNPDLDSKENMALFCLKSLTLSSDPDNRINSTAVNKDWYRCLRRHQREKSRRTKTWHVQYKINLDNTSLWTGRWADVYNQDQSSGDGELSLLSEQQNPALQWNYEIPKKKEPARLSPLLLEFGSSAVISPSVCVSFKNRDTSLKLTATSLEIDFHKEVQSFINPSQVCLLAEVAENISKSLQHDSFENVVPDKDSCSDLKSPNVIDSGVASVLSGKVSQLSKDPRKPGTNQGTLNQSESTNFEMLITGKKIVSSLYVDQGCNKPCDHDKQDTKLPVLSCHVIQPSLNINWFEEMSLDLAVYDILVSGCREDISSSTALPDQPAYDQSIFRSEKGKLDAKTGLYKPVLSLNVIDGTSRNISAVIGRPLLMSFYLGAFDKLFAFGDKIKLPVRAEKNEETSSNTFKSLVDSLQFETSRISVVISITPDHTSCSLVTKLRSSRGSVDSKRGQLSLSVINLNCNIEGLEIAVCKDEDYCTILSPCFFNVGWQADFIKHSGNIRIGSAAPKITLCVSSGYVRLRCGQQHCVYLDALLKEISNIKQPVLEEDNAVDCGSNEFVQPLIDHVNSAGNAEYSYDDLRTRPFEYCVNKGEKVSSHPSPHQIIFSDNEDGRPPTMTWRYPLPRFLTEVNIIPLPFHVDETAPQEDEISEIPCVIRYWDSIEQNYVTYGHFFLSQTEPSVVLLPDPTNMTSESEAVNAEEWQVVVDVAIEAEDVERSDEEEIPSDILEKISSTYKTPVSAVSLAACMKINSCFFPSKIPYLTCSFSIGCLQVTLLNNFNTAENDQSSRFSPFFLDPFTYPSEQEAVLANIDNLSFKTSHFDGHYPLHKVNFQLDLGVDVISYDDLSWRKFLSLSGMSAEISLENDSEKNCGQFLSMQKSKVSFDVEAFEVYISQSIVHTLLMTSDYWLKSKTTDINAPLLNHYIICNDTEDVLRFGQAGTDEDIVLASGQMYPYSWRSSSDHSLHICIDSIGDWKWTRPFAIDGDPSAFTRTIKHNTHQSILHVDASNIGGIQKQIVIRGGVIFKNCLSKDIEFEVILHHTEVVGSLQQHKISQVVKSFLVPSGTARPSVTYSADSITAVFVRFSGNTGSQGWTTSLPLQQSEVKDLTIQLNLEDGNEKKHCWYSVSNIGNTSYSQLQVCICPLFIIRNHLCWPVTMTSSSRDKGDTFTCYSRGKGVETELFGLESSTWYNVTFQLDGTNECTDPPLAVNSTFIDILKKKNRISVENCVYENEWPYADECSIPEEEPPNIVTSSSASSLGADSLTKSSADLQCQLLQKRKHLPTIIIEIRPKFIINNSSTTDLVLRDPEMHLMWQLASHTAVTSPVIQNSIQFGIKQIDDDVTIWSNEVLITEHMKPRGVSENGGKKRLEEISLHSSLTVNIIDVERKFCCQFAVSSKKRDGMIIINVTERFCIHNNSGSQFKCFPVLCEGDSEKVNSGICVDVSNARDPRFFAAISLQQESEVSDKHPDFSTCELKFYFTNEKSIPTELDAPSVFNLSREHLRENVVVKQPDGECLLFVVTSYCKDGVIHVFLDKDCCPCFVFVNGTAQELLIHSKREKQKRSSSFREHHVSSGPAEDHEERRVLCAGTSVSFQPARFNELFPRIDNLRTGLFQIAILPDSTVLSNEIEIINDTVDQKINIGDFELFMSCQQSSNIFHVNFNESITGNPSVRQSIHLPIINVNISKIAVIIMDHRSCAEVLAITAKKSSIHHQIESIESGFQDDVESLLFLDVGSIQIDNQLTNDYSHFPVVFLPLREASERYHGEISQNAPLVDSHASSLDSFFSLKMRLHSSNGGSLFVNDCQIKMQPVEIYLEDSFIYHIVAILDSFSPPRLNYNSFSKASRSETSLDSIRLLTNQILQPINIGRITISDIKILLSIHASVKMYLATDHMPIVLGRFHCGQAVSTTRELLRSFLYHYATEALVRAGFMLGSLEILANPTGFIRNIGNGIVDFFYLPYDGLTRGPSAFVSGITRGMSSFMRHTSVGALTSITNFASSLSRNLDRLSLDENHVLWQEEQRRRTLTHQSPGFQDALSNLAVSLLGAIAGVVEHPINNIQNADDVREAMKGVVSGFGKGLIGMVTKPLGGAMELLSQTGQGILLGTGLVIQPTKVRLALMEEEFQSMQRESYMKYCWKVVHLDFERFSDLFMVDDVHVTSVSDRHGYHGALILTFSALYLYDNDVSNIRKAFSCNEIVLRRPSKDCCYDIVIQGSERMSQKAGIMNEASDCSCSIENTESDHSDHSSSFMSVYLQMNPRFACLLLSQFNFQKDIINEKLCDELEALKITNLIS